MFFKLPKRLWYEIIKHDQEGVDMFRKAQQIIAVDNPYLYVLFPDGIKKYDISALYKDIPVFRELEDNNLFNKAYLSQC